MVVFLLLGVVWAAVLVPPWLQARREARPIASIMSFRSQLWSLQRATPHYGADVYTAYGDDAYDDEPAEGLVDDFESEGAGMHAFGRALAPVAGAWIAPGQVGAVVRRPSDPLSVRAASAPSAAVAHRRALAYRRRRQVELFQNSLRVRLRLRLRRCRRSLPERRSAKVTLCIASTRSDWLAGDHCSPASRAPQKPKRTNKTGPIYAARHNTWLVSARNLSIFCAPDQEMVEFS